MTKTIQVDSTNFNILKTDKIRTDCIRAKTQIANTATAYESSHTQALTLQDVETLSKCPDGPLIRYDTMIVYGTSQRDMNFAAHMTERLEMAGLQGNNSNELIRQYAKGLPYISFLLSDNL